MPAESTTGEGLSNVEQVLDLPAERAGESERVCVGDVLDAAGERALAPLVLIAGLIMMAPGIGDIPGVPVLMEALVILVTGQTLIGRQHIWLPESRFLDRWTGPRYTWAVRHAGYLVVALTTIAVAMATPIMEVIPFSANLAGLVVTAFGLALLARDGLLALFALAVGIGTGAFILYQLAGVKRLHMARRTPSPTWEKNPKIKWENIPIIKNPDNLPSSLKGSRPGNQGRRRTCRHRFTGQLPGSRAPLPASKPAL